MALHDTGGSLALGAPHDVDQLADLEDVGRDLLAAGVLGGVRGADLHDEPAGGHPGLREVAGLGLVHLAGVDGAVSELDRGVAVGRGAAHLGHHVRRSLDDGHRDEPTGGVPDLGHAELGAQQAPERLVLLIDE